MWKIVDTGVSTADNNMEIDRQLLAGLQGDNILHTYRWEEPSLTYGCFCQPEKLVSIEGVEKHSFDCAARPTGGGVVFHAWDYAFSILISAKSSSFSTNTLENYRFVNNLLIDVLQPIIGGAQLYYDSITSKPTFCMVRPTQYDIVVDGCKIGGAAQRRTRKGLLHQGTISIIEPKWEVLKDILRSSDLEAMQNNSGYLLPENSSLSDLEIMRNNIEIGLLKSVKRLNI